MELPSLRGCRLNDPLLSNTVNIQEIALDKIIPDVVLLQPGEHNENYWKNSIQYHFTYFKNKLRTNYK